jgi:hypothetical protein
MRPTNPLPQRPSTRRPPPTKAKSTNLWHSYTSLTPRTRLFIGGGLIAWSGLGLFLSDTAEAFFGFTPTTEDKERLRESLPRVTEVERK